MVKSDKDTVEVYRTCYNPLCDERVESELREAYCSWDCATFARSGGAVN